MEGRARIATYLGRTLMVVGFLLIALAWNGAASLDYLQGQFPYLLSAAVPGLALIIVGAGLDFIQAQREITASRAKQMAGVNASLIRLVRVIQEGYAEVKPPVDAHAAAPVAAVPAAARAGGGATPGTAGTQRVDQADDHVVAGRSSFHAATCHLVAGRDDMAVLRRPEAVAQDLSPCKICKP